MPKESLAIVKAEEVGFRGLGFRGFEVFLGFWVRDLPGSSLQWFLEDKGFCNAFGAL